MVYLTRVLFLLSQLQLLPIVVAVASQPAPSIRLDHATVTGVRTGSVESFLGIPYAQPPVGNLRLQLPRLIESYSGTLDATAVGNQCLQESTFITLPPEVLQVLEPIFELLGITSNATQSEDCLFINVVRPANISADTKLPVLVWIYGGGFADGSNSIPSYSGTTIVERSIQLGEPVIWVAMNYRLHVFGFLGGKEVKEAGVGNLGLQDQRTALRWVNKFIPAFGGDPSKVTIWGESAGSISVYFQLFANGGKADGLYRAGMMSSGFAVPTGDITDVQATYDLVVEEVGCATANDSLACLRTVPADSLLAAANNTTPVGGFFGLASAFMPRADGHFVTMPPLHLPFKAEIADVPLITGDCKDEGTSFSLSSLNITTDDEFSGYLSEAWFPGATPADLRTALQLYPSDPAAGSPFDTGFAYAFTPQYKRIAAVQGDWFFHGPRRLLLDNVSAKRTVYNFLSARGGFPGLGDAHGTDLLIALNGGDMADYFIRFINHLDPNPASGVQWPPYNTSTRSTLQFNDGIVPLTITADDQRRAGIEELTSLSLRFPF